MRMGSGMGERRIAAQHTVAVGCSAAAVERRQRSPVSQSTSQTRQQQQRGMNELTRTRGSSNTCNATNMHGRTGA